MRRRVIIIGGGASGGLLACHLLRQKTADVRITLIEKRERLGRGIAYGTGNPDHLLNVRAANMSAFAEEPDHFWKWLLASGEAAAPSCADRFCFVPRRTYGKYLEHLIGSQIEGSQDRIQVVRGEAVAITDAGPGISVALRDGSTHVGHVAVLATGHETLSTLPERCVADPWNENALGKIDPEAPILILGTGLTMVDCVLSLVGRGHRGPIYALSRHGLLPKVHRRIEPLPIDAADVPLGAGIVHLWRWFRKLVTWHAGRGGDWRSAVDAVRPFAQQIWQNLPLDDRRRFLRHGRVWWAVHRHRMAPEVATRLRALMAGGQLNLMAACVQSIEPQAAEVLIRFRRRAEPVIEKLQVARIIDCRGIVTDPLASRNPVLQHLLSKGLARADPLRIGIDVSDQCAIIDAQGKPSRHLFAVGPLTRAAFWEIIAIPDIRVQCARLARQLV